MNQIDIFEEIIVDNFCGHGGASWGIESATGRAVDIAINHSLPAINQHQANHPYTRHYREDVWNIDPVKVCQGRPVGLAWFSPDCKHFSKAKGGKPKDKKIRGLAWVACKWAALVRPRVIMLENVEEFQDWGPLGRKGKPIKAKKGETFRKFIGQLRDLGYTLEYRELVAADYGAPTTRKRFFLVARCDGKPIVWPERTHAPREHPLVKAGGLLPRRGAYEIIDWSLLHYSIFESKEQIKEKYGATAVRPLAENTMRRIIRGVDKFTIRSGKPFIVPSGYGERSGQNPRVNDIDAPLGTVVGTAKHYVCQPMVSPFMAQCNHAGDGHTGKVTDPLGTITAKHTEGVVTPILVPIKLSNTGGSVGSDASQPVHTVRTAGGQMLTASSLIQYHTEQADYVRGQGLGLPINTVDGSNRYGLVSASLIEYYGNGNPIDVRDPMHTVTGHDREAVVAAHIAEFKGQNIGQHIGDPLLTITAGGGQFASVRTEIVRYEPGRDLKRWPEIRGMLNKYCGYHLADDEVILLILGGVAWYIGDISLRMLVPRELFRAMDFPDDYIIDRDFKGNVCSKADQTAGVGNAVVPTLAAALVRANLPEWCKGERIQTRAAWENRVAM